MKFLSALVLLAVLFLALLAGCSSAPRHQRGGAASQSLGLSAPVTPRSLAQPGASPVAAAAPAQTLVQPENPEGESMQELRETVTTTTPAGDVVTTVRTARTVIGGSQDLAEMVKAYAASEYTRRLALALVLAVVAFAVRRDWPSLQWVLGGGAVLVAFCGLGWALAVLGAGGGVVLAYYLTIQGAGGLASFPRGG